jgi:hypothetical protein
MKLTNTPPDVVFKNFKCTKNSRSRYCPSIRSFKSVADFMFLKPATNLEHLGSKDEPFANRQMLNQFCSTNTFGQVMSLYDAKPQDASSNENYVFIDINLYLKRDVLPMSVGHFNSRVPQGRMLVQTDLAIEGCLMEETIFSVMKIHMDHYERLTKHKSKWTQQWRR